MDYLGPTRIASQSLGLQGMELQQVLASLPQVEGRSIHIRGN